MTIQECYAQMGADYNEVFRRLYNEAMIRKFVLLFPKDDSFHNLEAALKEQNVVEKQYRITMAAIQALD